MSRLSGERTRRNQFAKHGKEVVAGMWKVLNRRYCAGGFIALPIASMLGMLDLSFPAILKTYIEWVNVPGVAFRYSEEGRPVGMCRAKSIYFVGTSGGPVADDVFGFGYVEALAKNFWGIGDVRRFAATGLDIVGTDAEAILREAEREIDSAKV